MTFEVVFLAIFIPVFALLIGATAHSVRATDKAARELKELQDEYDQNHPKEGR